MKRLRGGGTARRALGLVASAALGFLYARHMMQEQIEEKIMPLVEHFKQSERVAAEQEMVVLHQDNAAVAVPSRAWGPLFWGAPSLENLRFHGDYVSSLNYRTKQPNWVAEALTAAQLERPGPGVDRKFSRFDCDPTVPPPFRSTNKDFQGSGYSRGHLAAAGSHRTTQEVQNATFLLNANIVPQELSMNGADWYRLELFTRDLTKKFRNVVVFSGPMWAPDDDDDDEEEEEEEQEEEEEEEEEEEGRRRRKDEGQAGGSWNKKRKAKTTRQRMVRYPVIGESRVAVPTHMWKVVLCDNAPRLDLLEDIEAGYAPATLPPVERAVRSVLDTVRQVPESVREAFSSTQGSSKSTRLAREQAFADAQPEANGFWDTQHLAFLRQLERMRVFGTRIGGYLGFNSLEAAEDEKEEWGQKPQLHGSLEELRENMRESAAVGEKEKSDAADDKTDLYEYEDFDNTVYVAAFVMPNRPILRKLPLTSYITTLDYIERSTGLSFLTRLGRNPSQIPPGYALSPLLNSTMGTMLPQSTKVHPLCEKTACQDAGAGVQNERVMQWRRLGRIKCARSLAELERAFEAAKPGFKGNPIGAKSYRSEYERRKRELMRAERKTPE